MTARNFTFPYDWSNPDISEDALILNVLQRGIFEDICEICILFGVDVVEKKFAEIEQLLDPIAQRIISRSLANIKEGFARVET